MLEPTRETRKAAFEELSATTSQGMKRREVLALGIQSCRHEFSGLGIEMNQHYESTAVFIRDQQQPPQFPEDPVLYYNISTYSGSRLPHAWLNKAILRKPISTIDLAGHGHFTLFTGAGGGAWKDAAAIVTERLRRSISGTAKETSGFEGDEIEKAAERQDHRLVGLATSILPLEVHGKSRVPSLEIKVWSIGWRLDWEDVYLDWQKRRQIEEDGCILVRPDRTVAWRCMKLGDMQGKESEKLVEVMERILRLE